MAHNKPIPNEIEIIAYQRPNGRIICDIMINDQLDCVAFDQSDFLQYLFDAGQITKAEAQSKTAYFKGRYFDQVAADIVKYLKLPL